MISGRNREIQVAAPVPATPRPGKPAAGWYRLVSCLFARKAVSEAVVTKVHFNAGPAVVWNHIRFYEEIPGLPPFLLRALLPHPVRTEGDKSRVGATVRCAYTAGYLLKRVSAVSQPHLMQFDVIEQRLGIEECLLAVSGSYEISRSGHGSKVVLTTNYRAYLRPRWAWRSLEELLVGQLHRYILDGMLASVASVADAGPIAHPASATSWPRD